MQQKQTSSKKSIVLKLTAQVGAQLKALTGTYHEKNEAALAVKGLRLLYTLQNAKNVTFEKNGQQFTINNVKDI